MSPSPPSAKIGPPKTLTTGGGGTSAPDPLYDIYQRLASIESSMGFLVAAVDDSKSKIEAVAKDISDARAMFSALIPIAKGVRTALWGILTGGGVIAGTVFTIWLKHRMGW